MENNFTDTNELEAHQQRLLENRRVALELLAERVNLYELTPERAAPDTLKNYFATQIQLETGRIFDVTTEDQLETLNRLENWYTSKSLAFPNQDWLQKQRESLTRNLR
jgi:hypothetical protein